MAIVEPKIQKDRQPNYHPEYGRTSSESIKREKRASLVPSGTKTSITRLSFRGISLEVSSSSYFHRSVSLECHVGLLVLPTAFNFFLSGVISNLYFRKISNR